jgi:hypothetical protein
MAQEEVLQDLLQEVLVHLVKVMMVERLVMQAVVVVLEGQVLTNQVDQLEVPDLVHIQLF